MASTLNQPDDAWKQIAPLLDEALLRLGHAERDALVLRYFEGRSLNEIGVAQGASEQAAKKRVSRALEKLRSFFARRGVSSTTAIIAGAISGNSVQAAPAGLTQTISAVALAKGAAASTSTLTLVKGALKIMAWTKAKTVIVTTVAVLLAAGATTGVKLYLDRVRVDSYFLANYRHFQHLPAGMFLLRPTHFETPAEGLDYSCETDSPAGDHVTWSMVRNRSLAQLFARMYNCGVYQVVLPPGAPKGHFDYLFTLRDPNGFAPFETAMRELGYAAHWEDRNTDVWLLKVQTPGSPGLRPPSIAMRPRQAWNAPNQLEFRNLSLASLVNEIENVANVPVTDETALSAPYDFDLNCAASDLANHDWNAVNDALGQLGLELVSTNLPMRMLVVEEVR